MINNVDKDSKRTIIACLIFLIIFIIPLLDKDVLFLFKGTQDTVGIMRNMDLDTRETIVEYEIAGEKYVNKTYIMGFEKDGEVELICDVNNPNKILEKSRKTTLTMSAVFAAIMLIVIMCIKSSIGGQKIYNNKNAKVVEGEIFEILDDLPVCRVCLKAEGYEQVFYLDSDVNLKPILEKLNINKLPIYLCGNGIYRVDTRKIEEKIEIVKERVFFA